MIGNFFYKEYTAVDHRTNCNLKICFSFSFEHMCFLYIKVKLTGCFIVWLSENLNLPFLV